MKALPTLESPLPWFARKNAGLSLLLLSSNCRVPFLRWAAAQAPGPRCASRASRHWAWLRTTMID